MEKTILKTKEGYKNHMLWILSEYGDTQIEIYGKDASTDGKDVLAITFAIMCSLKTQGHDEILMLSAADEIMSEILSVQNTKKN